MRTHLPQLDGLRGIAILIVVLGHILVFPWGIGMKALGFVPPIGVDLFFVLSGFLITNILLPTKSEPRYFRNFYARRALRTWPIYAALLVFMFAIANGRIGVLSIPANLHWQYFGCYIQNLVYQPSQMGPVPLAGTWSLAVEEQFYLVWPIVVWLLPSRKLWMYLFPVILIAPIARVVLVHVGYDPYANPICRFDAMAMGSLVSVWMTLRLPNRAQIGKASLVVFCFAVLGEILGHFTGLTSILSKSFVSAMFAATLALSIESNFLQVLLGPFALRFTGKISYCMYLCHSIVGYLILAHFPGTDLKTGILRSALILLGTYTVAIVSWHGFESQILRLKKFFEQEKVRSFAK